MAKKKLGKILIIPRGDYDAAVLYRRLDLVKYSGTSYLCKTDNTIGIEPTNIERWYKVVDAVGDMDIFFEEVSKRENISSNDSLSLILGKIKRWFDDLKPVAFSGKYKDLADTPENATISVAGLMSEKDKKKLDDITESADSVSYSASLTNGTKVGTIHINGEDYDLYAPTNTDTKNTAGAKDSTQKLYLIGATSQADAPQTYSQDTAYVGTDGCIYSNNKKTITVGEVSRSAAITIQGNYALDAIEKNASIEGTLAYLISSQNTDFANQLSQLNSNMTTIKKIDVNSDFASAIIVYCIGKIVSVDIDGKIIANARTIFATGLPPALATTWIQDLHGYSYRLYPNGSILCMNNLTDDTYVNLHFMYVTNS